MTIQVELSKRLYEAIDEQEPDLDEINSLLEDGSDPNYQNGSNRILPQAIRTCQKKDRREAQ